MKTALTGAIVAAAALLAGFAGAQTFEQSLNDALKKDGAVLSQIPSQKAVSKQDAVEAQRGPGGDHRGGDHRGGDHRGGDRRGPGNDHRGDRGDHRGPVTHPGRDGHPDHHWPDHRPDHRPDGDWNRWHGHPGWGSRYHGRWGWDPYGRPLWLGWVVWSGWGRASCLSYYRDLNVNCHAECGGEQNACVSNCSIYAPGSVECLNSCGTTAVFCNESCSARYEDYWRTCPF